MEKILCVEDDQSVLQLYEEEFSEDGYEAELSIKLLVSGVFLE